ncbi:MAG: aminopeptidase P family protein [Deltaproteobacteria bacterium]|nr:aminopeptidase P family protein [Deltaproteobacteria bacterium]MBW2075686.1 aminopeptidase P family protein [Deltaproteobacteria bacterium]RLB80099.1 MAG: aminopeptidase P family protein [Deltaproteobacteria bacterium]
MESTRYRVLGKTTKNRLARLRARLQTEPLDTFLVLQGENRRYLSGFTGEDGQFDESAGALFITLERQLLATDSRYETQAQIEAPDFEIYRYREGLAQALPEILKTLHTERLGFESVRLSYLQFQRFEEQLKNQNLSVSLVPTENFVEELRMIKEEKELEAIRHALAVSESVFESIRETLSPGVSERELAWAIEKGLRERGAESVAFPPIVASGPNAALPHAIPTDRPVKSGEPILFDWGARLNGYCSDISRTLVLGQPDTTFKTIYQVVQDAQSMAIEVIKPGISTQVIDKTARDYITAKGFGDHFGHGLGHGVGLATHEKPHLSPIRPMNLKVGMVTTVEPGIYIPGWGGVRLENMVVVKEDGAVVLNRHPL